MTKNALYVKKRKRVYVYGESVCRTGVAAVVRCISWWLTLDLIVGE